jgi:hippurate hydrolase
MTIRVFCLLAVLISLPAFADDLTDAVSKDYDEHLAGLFDHFHRNPELSTIEHETARRMAMELDMAGFAVTEGVGGTGVVAIMENGPGPTVMMRADMDGLPVEEKSGLENASRAQQKDPITGNTVFTMHACGHDVHITSLVGTARYMAANKDTWRGKQSECWGPRPCATMPSGNDLASLTMLWPFMCRRPMSQGSLMCRRGVPTLAQIPST